MSPPYIKWNMIYESAFHIFICSIFIHEKASERFVVCGPIYFSSTEF